MCHWVYFTDKLLCLYLSFYKIIVITQEVIRSQREQADSDNPTAK